MLKAHHLSIYPVDKEELMESIKILSGEDYSGRLPGHEGYNKAAEYMAGEFENLGLKKFNDSYFQKLNVEYNEIFSPVKFISYKNGAKEKEYQLGKDFVCRGFTGSGEIKTEIVFCGYGADKDFYSDYNSIDVKGKIVVIFKPNPLWKVGDNDWDNGYPRAKSNIAAKYGAKGIILVSTPNSNPQKSVASVMDGEGEQELHMPQIHVDLDVADELLKESGYTLSQLQSIIDSTKKPFSIQTGTLAEMYIKADYDKSAETMNVVGLLEGSDPDLKNEYLIIGAHLDHVGKQGNVVFPGANDNASGSAAVLEIARTFVKNDIRPKRSVIFTLFASEELGLYGAKYMSENLPVHEKNVIAMFNLDCIAFGDSMQVGNGLSSPKLYEIAKNVDKRTDNFLVINTWKGGGADAQPFHDKGIPALYFVSTNSYENIHTIDDTPESLSPDLIEKITRLAFLTAVEVADGKYEREAVIK